MSATKTQPRIGSCVGSVALALAVTANESQAEQWIHVMPSGEFSARDGRGPWAMHNAEAVIAASSAFAGKKPIPVDYDHQIDHAGKNGQPAPAAGWIKQLQARPDGLWGLVEWTEKASAHLDAKEYRYLSPVFNHTPSGEVTRVLRAALTNNPALELTALASTQGTDMLNQDPMVELRGLLELPNDADMTAIIQMVSDYKSAACGTKPDVDQFVSIGEFQEAIASTTVAFQRQAEETAWATAVDQAIQQGHILPQHKEVALALCHNDKDKFDQFVATISPFLKGIRSMQTGGLAPEQRGASERPAHIDETARAVCKALGHSQQEFIQLGVTHAN
ncbi:MAG TPA: phage protease [Methylobacter sp.]|jgi:phage I-like protein